MLSGDHLSTVNSFWALKGKELKRGLGPFQCVDGWERAQEGSRLWRSERREQGNTGQKQITADCLREQQFLILSPYLHSQSFKT